MASVEDLLDQIKQALQSANPRQACQLAEQASALDSADPRLILLYGVALRRSDQSIKAIPLLEHMVEEAPTLAIARHELALGYQAVGRLSDAVIALETLVEQDPLLKSAWRDLYHARSAEGDDVGAAEAYRQSLDTNGLDPLLQRALSFMESGRLGMAEGICREYLKHHPHDVNAMRLLAEVGTTLGILDEALLLLERCLELAPNFTVAQANYATALARSQRFDEALANTKALQQEEPNRVSHKVQHAAVLSMAGRYPEAHDKFEEVLAIIPDNSKILTNYGHSLRYGGKGSEAIAAYERAITADPLLARPTGVSQTLKPSTFLMTNWQRCRRLIKRPRNRGRIVIIWRLQWAKLWRTGLSMMQLSMPTLMAMASNGSLVPTR